MSTTIQFIKDVLNEQAILNESSLGRIWDHVQHSPSFGVISPCRDFMNKKILNKNKGDFVELKAAVRGGFRKDSALKAYFKTEFPDRQLFGDLLPAKDSEEWRRGFGFIPMYGGYDEKDPQNTGQKRIIVDEFSLFVPNISKEMLAYYGKKYNQDTVIWMGHVLKTGKNNIWNNDDEKNYRLDYTMFDPKTVPYRAEMTGSNVDQPQQRTITPDHKLLPLNKSSRSIKQHWGVIYSRLKKGSKQKTGDKFLLTMS